ncbi:MAG TPA: hypothetical protein DIW80_13985 [Gordonia polyisoprenivorans]|uniref:Uncharacterized protein n=3 Tax=Gordonia polyisoprenivorans TaxID=84595 RepID=A0A846WJP9_9ACTN|nr:hypothetical protein [Gordonia polyisoprenivorans]NKY01894.1 hypothetical protein [Gordonia polyisoprenivorans]QUD84151.1 hypothetical protein J8M97_05865 [Gordonia polyisoprenivorans]HCS58164.1 hypothetical protein [Gordonia polyisoprenivorans]
MPDLLRAGQHISDVSTGVSDASDPTCTLPAMPGSTSDTAVVHLMDAAKNSKQVVAGRLEAIAEAVGGTGIVFIAGEEQGEHALAGLGDFNQPLAR